jgi:ribosomal protein L12E/L44/L45/RPP1/RPP2
MMKAMFAMLALVLGLTFGAATFVQADEKKAAPAAEKKEEKKAEKKAEKKEEKKAEKK